MSIEDRADKLKTQFSNHPNKSMRIDNRKEPNQRFKSALPQGTDEEKLLAYLSDPQRYGAETNGAWVKVPEHFYKAARQLSYNGKIEWFERTKEAKMAKEEINVMESVCEALGSIASPRLEVNEDYIGGQFERLDTESKIFTMQIRDEKGGKTNFLNISPDDLQKIKSILQASKTAN